MNIGVFTRCPIKIMLLFKLEIDPKSLTQRIHLVQIFIVAGIVAVVNGPVASR